MYFYSSQTDNAHFNTATEEYFLKSFDADFFCLYINSQSIIVGKHQNTIAEINVPYVFENNIKVVRRLSGGGTVFHDNGNLNFCFIQKGEKGNLVDFTKYTKPILYTLQNIGVDAYLRGKSDLVIANMKFSGNAEHIYKNKVLHHGTMLFSSELSELNSAIKTDWSKFTDRAVRSNRSKVTNITEHLQNKLTIDEFKKKVTQTVIDDNPNIKEYFLTDADKIAIDKLVKEKYSTWEWNFGYSPKYEFEKSIIVSNLELKAKIKIAKGIIVDITITYNNKNVIPIEEALLNTPHHYTKMKIYIEPIFVTNKKLPFSFNDIMRLMF